LRVLPTVAVNCCVPLERMVAVVGEMEMVTTGGVVVMVTVAFTCLLVSATLVAVTVAFVVVVTAGPVYKPVVEIVPRVVLQVTA